ncbi:hypothetical protein Agabi119p4_2631 [Agaricus bisporus var. burnettii]|uniref:F-box domain-containing protein n=1 Tax=Agaricus bisporus var. burnettii TaxID=192524 RepID=A0A8H7KKI7_AGABI|nr:hypothetical protein Agabi119p4_2631 [Agaricus bisporus var. burnettii]
MASAVNSPECDYLRSITALYVFAGEQAELIHVNEQLSSLDRHIAELNTLRSTLHRRTVQLQNQLLPIYTFPLEILSYIFQLVVGPENYHRYSGGCYQECLRQAFVLSSVSSHFRHVAFGTSELWDRISLQIVEDKAIGNISPLLQHCISCASRNVSLCIFERRSNEDYRDTRSVIENFITLETTRKVKIFHLHGSTHVWMWIPEINAPSFPMIETLAITCEEIKATDFRKIDFGEMNNLTRLVIIGSDWLDVPIILPPSLQYLGISTVSQKVFVSLLYQCPNLVECSADTGRELDGPPFTKPLILNHLRRLQTGAMNAITMSSSLQYLQLPSLESLELNHFNERPSLDIVPFCCNVSATLTSLAISTRSKTLDYEDLHQLCRFSFPKLRDLRFTSIYVEPLMSVIHSLSPLDTESNNPRPLNLPALEFIIFNSPLCSEGDPRILLDLLKNWWSDEALYLHVQLRPFLSSEAVWTPALREEFRLIKGSRQIKITWGHNEITESPAPLESQP